MLTLRGRAAWAHDFNPESAAAATFQTLPGASFVVNGAARHMMRRSTASAEMKWLNGGPPAATFEGEFSSVTRATPARASRAIRGEWGFPELTGGIVSAQQRRIRVRRYRDGIS